MKAQFSLGAGMLRRSLVTIAGLLVWCAAATADFKFALGPGDGGGVVLEAGFKRLQPVVGQSVQASFRRGVTQIEVVSLHGRLANDAGQGRVIPFILQCSITPDGQPRQRICAIDCDKVLRGSLLPAVEFCYRGSCRARQPCPLFP